ncbi:MAG: hypothetical protein MUR46_12660 [Loktanella sp.]|jgi:hypothetical protein|nr:hypothetical protein [bacterium]MDO7558649.1 hypothetical protein [Loktanella sp.]MDO7608445.1 hypothetical protein [Loktanella sp.]MDO7623762.1 hypothetical protein [Loktanella sp.]MDO7626958.1 hypothetical protein [Loktanella sp.]
MNLRWLLMAKRWAQNPPSMGRVKLVVGVIVVCLLIVGAEKLGLTPDWMTADRVRRIQ